ncbi:MAG: DciA family protein [Candidatus Omnitrophota bacterium]
MSTHIKHLLDKFLDKKRAECIKQGKIQQIVNQFLNSETQGDVYLKGVVGNMLVFKADSSSLRYDFQLKKDKILNKIKEEFPQIQEIKVEIN